MEITFWKYLRSWLATHQCLTFNPQHPLKWVGMVAYSLTSTLEQAETGRSLGLAKMASSSETLSQKKNQPVESNRRQCTSTFCLHIHLHTVFQNQNSKWISKPGVVAHACNPSTLEDQGQPLLHTEFNQGQPELHKTLSQRSTSASQGVLKHL